MSRMSRKQKRKLNQDGIINIEGKLNNSVFHLKNDISMLTEAQVAAAEAWNEGYHLFLHGCAGTGKTFIALYFAFQKLFDGSSDIDKVYIIRSPVAGRDQGFQPGTIKQKHAVYETPYYGICEQLFGRKDAYEVLKMKDKVEFKTTSFLRGETFDNSVVVVDEIQNLSDQEAHTIMTRVGNNTKIIFAGDIMQDDLTSKRFNERSGIKDFIKIINRMEEFDLIEFLVDDIVRSDIVRSYIVARLELDL